MKKISFTLLIVILITVLGSGISSVAFAAYLDPTEAFDDTYVMNDLNGATIWGKTFDVADYPKNNNGELRLLDFAEYCFSTKYEMQNNYGLYLYIYNPQAIKFANDERNKIQIAVEYNDDNEPSRWDKFHITICSASSDNLFYKFKIDNVSDTYSRVATSQYRRYDVSGIELVTPGEINAHDYKVGGIWTYSGYAKGCHISSMDESTLSSDVKALQTVDLDDLQFTVYRTWQTAELADQLTSVYFSVPKEIAQNYDELYSIQAETYQYLTAPIFCIYDRFIMGVNGMQVDYDKLFFELGLQRTLETPSTLGNDVLKNILYWDAQHGGVNHYSAATGYNFTDSREKDFVLLPKLMWLFQVSTKNEFRVSSTELLEYMQEWSFKDDINGKYDSDLFSDKYYSYNMDYKTVTNGYLPIDIDISGKDDFTLVGSDTKYSFWKKLFGSWDGTVGSSPIKPIEEVTSKDLKGLKDEEISKKYYVMQSDVADFKSYVNAREKEGRVTYIFHFAKSEYFTTSVNIDICPNVGYLAQEVAYLDFDIISMGYRKGDVINILPVVCSPIDIIGGVEPGTDPPVSPPDNLWAIIIAIVVVVILLVLLFKLLGVSFSKKKKN